MENVVHVVHISTPRHGYLKVEGCEARARKISQSFSEYSYYDEDEDIFYLEEDCDASMFLKRCELDNVSIVIDDEDFDSEEEAEKITCHSCAGDGGDWGYFGELEQNHDGLERFFESEEDEDEEEEDEE